MGVKCSGVINNGPRTKLQSIYTLRFAKYTLIFFALFTVPFSQRLGTSRIPWGQVSSVLKWSNEVRILANDGPRTKLGYDNNHFS